MYMYIDIYPKLEFFRLKHIALSCAVLYVHVYVIQPELPLVA